MTKQKNTKRALLASVLSMMLCMAMLVGSTFAWFTDSVTSGKNKIVAGNLDVELYAKDVAGKYNPVTADTNLFMEDALWEPGHVEVINLKVANLGTLALKYQFGINIASEKGSVNVSGEEFKLSDYIKFAVIDGEQSYENRDAAIAAADTSAVALSALAVNENGVLYPAAKATTENPAERLVTLVAYMPTTVGNEANYKTGKESPEIELGVNLVATQTPYEKDSFGNDYDEIAALVQNGYEAVDNTESFKNALSEGKDIVLTDNITATAVKNADYGGYPPVGFEMKGGTLDGNGKTVTVTQQGGGDYIGIMTSGGTIRNLTVENAFRAILLMYPSEDVILDNVHAGGTGIGYAINTGEAATSDDVDLIVTNSSFAGWSSFSNIASASFTACQFEMGSYYGGTVYDRLVKPYVTTVFKDCNFSENYYIDLSSLGKDCIVTLENCTVDGTIITAENWDSLLDQIELPSGRTLESCIIFK